jgi:hypothetical protein
MIGRLVTRWLRWLGGTPCFRVYGKGRPEPSWRMVDVFATHRRDVDGRLPLWRGTCISLSNQVIIVGWDFAEQLLLEQVTEPASREHPVEVCGGRIRDLSRREAAGGPAFASFSEILAHECGHTWQAIRLGAAYYPIGAALTLFREGPRPWNRFENHASEVGQFGGIVNGSVCASLMDRLAQH